MLGWAIALMLLALLLYTAEIFVPSGGLIGLVATCSLIGGIVCLYLVDQTAGVVATVVALVAAPFVIWFMVRYLPDSPIGRRMALTERQQAKAARYIEVRDADGGQALVGKTGLALTDLRPSGKCLIDGHRLDCLAESGLVEKGTRVVVVSVKGLEINVRPVSSANQPVG